MTADSKEPSDAMRRFLEGVLALRADAPPGVTLVIHLSPPAPSLPPPPPTPPPRPTIQEIDLRAVRLLMLHPDWSGARIAREIGTARSNLYRCRNYRIARAALEAGRAELPRGRKDRHGNIE